MSDDSEINDDNEFEMDFDDEGFDDFSGQNDSSSLKNNPFVKFGIILGIVAVVLIAVFIVGEDKQMTGETVVKEGSNVSEPPATGVLSENYRDAVEEENERRINEARNRGTSAVPTPIDPPATPLDLTDTNSSEEDPLARWRRLQKEKERRTAIPEPVEEPPPPVDDRGMHVSALAEAMSAQMSSILEAQGNRQQKMQVVSVTDINWLKALENEERQKSAEFAENSGRETSNNTQTIRRSNSAGATIQEPEIVIPAGDIIYAQTLIEANTDVPGPVVAMIASGKFRGSKLLGNFTQNDDYLTLNFNTMVVDGKSKSISAVAIDPQTTLPGMATEVNNRYFKRLVLPMASAFVQGLASAVAESGSTTIVVSGSGTTTSNSNNDLDNDQEVATGIEEAGEKLGEFIDEEEAKTRPMVKIHAGTPIGVLFLQEVME